MTIYAIHVEDSSLSLPIQLPNHDDAVGYLLEEHGVLVDLVLVHIKI